MVSLWIFAVLILICLSCFFAASESAFIAIPPHKVDSLLKQRKSGAKALKQIKAEPDKVLMAILIGNNVVNITAATLASSISMKIAQVSSFPEATLLTISAVLVTLLLLTRGEVIPKTFAIRRAEKISLLIAPFYVLFVRILSPVIRILAKCTTSFTKKEKKTEISDEEIEAFIEHSKNAGAFEEAEYQQIKKMLTFNEITVEEAMTPRIKINAISDSMTLEQAIDKLLTLHHTRIPVYHQSIDDIEKVVTLRELINIKNNHNNGNITLKELILNPIIKIPSPTPIDVALNAFKKSHKHIALVMDEYGGVAGVITLEDIIEEIFGDIQDENDIETTPIKKQGRNTRIVQSFVRIDEFLSESKLSFEEIWLNEKEFDGETLSYLITTLLERFPVEGEEIQLEVQIPEKHSTKHSEEKAKKNLTIKILQISGNTIGDLRISLGQ